MSLYGLKNNKPQNHPAFAAQKARIEQRNAQVIAHEEAHKSGAGPQAIGNPVYQKKMVSFGNGETMEAIVGGHQAIAVPASVSFKASRDVIEKTRTAAEYTIAGAEAPADALSSADKAVAAKGRQVLFSAQRALMDRLSLESRMAQDSQKPLNNRKLTTNAVNRAKPGNKRNPINYLA